MAEFLKISKKIDNEKFKNTNYKVKKRIEIRYLIKQINLFELIYKTY